MTADDLGPKIRRARQRKRWSQQRLADEIGVALRTVGAWERGETYPRRDVGDIEALERALGVSLTGDETPEDPPFETAEEERLWDLASGLGIPERVRRGWIDDMRQSRPRLAS